ncbi:MAG: hypothetical protein FJX76_26325 [Armatimonadetes bacterium]|nr:hypothetical protein [Armatimonadota bacterium]
MTLPQPPAARLHPYLLAAMICAALVFFTIPVIAAILAPRFVAKRAQDQFGVCSDNLKKTIVVALEMYGADHNQRFPLELSALLPTYVKKIPTCPAAEIDTYSKGYRVTGEGDGYVVMCLGHNHGGANLEPDFPQYSSSEGFRK